MTQEDIIKKINNAAPYIVVEDLDEWIVPKLVLHYKSKLNSLAYVAYGASDGTLSPVAKSAFLSRATAEIRSGVNTFLFKSEHWRQGRDINPYLLTCLNRLAKRIRWDTDSSKKSNVPICPGCKNLGRREFLKPNGKLLSCENCISEISRLEIELSGLKKNPSLNRKLILNYEVKLRIHNTFANHSRAGYRCPECSKFIPESANGTFGIGCPYNNCSYHGNISKLESMIHPLGLTHPKHISLNSNISGNGASFSPQDYHSAGCVEPDIEMEIREDLEQDLNVLTNVIEDQINLVERTNASGTMMQKLLMYEAYQRMLQRYPEDMISYLVHRKQSADFPIQSRIFQEYVSLMEEALPYKIGSGKNAHDVISLTDPNIQLFSGISEFEATIRSDYTIPNNTVETYTGGRKFKCYGPCFIGMIIDVLDVNKGESIKDKIDNYSFVQIKMRQVVEPGTLVKVKHFRIIPHYEMGALVYLQRIRKKIVDSVYLRKNGEKRMPGI